MGSPPSLTEMEMTGRLQNSSTDTINPPDYDLGVGCFSDEESEATLGMFSGSQIFPVSFTPPHHRMIDYCSMPINSTLRFSSISVSQRIPTSSPAFLSPDSSLLARSSKFSPHLTPSPTWDGDHLIPTAASENVEWECGCTSLQAELFESETKKGDQCFSEYGDDFFTKTADFSGLSNSSNSNSNSTYSSSHKTTLWDLLRSDPQDRPQTHDSHYKRKSLSWKSTIQAITSKSKRIGFSSDCNKNLMQPQLNLPVQVCYLSAPSTQVGRVRKRTYFPWRGQIVSFFTCIKS